VSILDYAIFALYMGGVLGFGIYHFLRNTGKEDYYVGSRSIKAHHVGLSIVATDVGGGFSIGLGGLGFAMGLSGSWLLFSGLVGAWLSAVFIIPRIKRIDAAHAMMTYPDFLRYRYGGNVALVAALISGLGYLGFTGAQMLAGAKLASATMLQHTPFGMDPLLFSLLIIAAVTIGYTVIGGLKAVIYTDTIQWIILLTGLIAVTIPVTLYEIGGWERLRTELPHEYFTLTNLSLGTLINWMVTIIPIWIIGMTLYQRMYACKNEQEARRAWYIAGILEYPIMAFTGVFIGMCARVVFPQAEPEMGLPMLIRDLLPAGVTGIVIAAYFSAIMSTADSCLMASSGNVVNDLIERFWLKNLTARQSIRLSMAITLLLGVLAVLLAAQFNTVLDAILYAYAFMVSGLFIPTLGAYFWKRGSAAGALAGMLTGGLLTVLLMTNALPMPEMIRGWNLDFSLYGILTSAIFYVSFSLLFPGKSAQEDAPLPIIETAGAPACWVDTVEKIGGATVQHGPKSNRIYLMKLGDAEPEALCATLDALALEKKYGKIFAKVPESCGQIFLTAGYQREAEVPGFFRGKETAWFLGKYFSPSRQIEENAAKHDSILQLAKCQRISQHKTAKNRCSIRKCTPEDIEAMSALYRNVFPSYPFPIDDPEYLLNTMQDHVQYYAAEHDGVLVGLASAEMDPGQLNAEMTDFATRLDWRGQNLAQQLLAHMETAMRQQGVHTAYTIARSISPSMNIVFARRQYAYAGRLINNTHIGGHIESMNVWFKTLFIPPPPRSSSTEKA